MPTLEQERGVPAWALPGGGPIYAWGLHAGTRKKFRARVIDLRRSGWPRIVVKYEALDDGTVPTSDLLLPEMKVAYLSLADLEQIN